MPGGVVILRPSSHSMIVSFENGRQETFKSAVTAMHRAAKKAMERCQIDISQIKCVILTKRTRGS